MGGYTKKAALCFSCFVPSDGRNFFSTYIAESTYVSSKIREHQISQNYYTAPALPYLDLLQSCICADLKILLGYTKKAALCFSCCVPCDGRKFFSTYIAESTYVSSESRNHQISQNYYTAPALPY